MLHAKEDTAKEPYEPVVHGVTSPIAADDEEYRSPATGLSPRRQARTQKALLSVHSDESDDPFSCAGYDSEGKPAANHLERQDSMEDVRFRVNGIVVDREIPGGAKPKWEDVYQVMFQSSTPNGQTMALTLLIMVSISVTVAVLDSVKAIREEIGDQLLVLEVFFTVAFSIEYSLRVLCLRKPAAFVLSMLGAIDLCALVPTYMGLLIPSARPLIHLAVLRVFRVMRVFRILRLARFVDASSALSDSIHSNKRRIAVFLVGLFTMILVIGCAMYLIEGDRDGFSNIPVSLYWTVVTITTVGYGDIAPETVLGRMLATLVMFAGYGLIACPLVLNQSSNQDLLTEINECPRCFRRMHQDDANFCRVCGAALRQPRVQTIKAEQRRLRLAKLHTPSSDLRAQPISSTTSTTRSNVHLLNTDDDTDRHSVTVNL